MKSYSFVSYKGGAGRTFVLVNVAEALVIQGCNVLILDLDIEAPGVSSFSSRALVNNLFQPENLYRLPKDDEQKTEPLWSGSRKPEAGEELPFPGLLDVIRPHREALEQALGQLNSHGDAKLSAVTIRQLQDMLDDVPVYECRTPVQHPLEGRLFLMPVSGRFKYTPPEEGSDYTPWVYSPEESEGGRASLVQLAANLLFHRKIPFFRELQSSLEERVRKVSAIDYMLVDERPGLEGRTLVDAQWTDGTVLVMGTSRGNMAGSLTEARLLETIFHQAKEKKQKIHPIINLVISQHIGAQFGEKIAGVKQPPMDVWLNSVDQAGLRTFINNASGDFLKKPEKSLHNCLGLLRLRAAPLFGPQDDIHNNIYGKQPDDGMALRQLWAEELSESDKREKLGTLDQYLSILPFATKYRLNDEPVWLRGLSNGVLTNDPNPTLTKATAVLAGHLRTWDLSDPVRTDSVARLWDAWLVGGESAKNVVKELTTSEEPWQALWLRAEIIEKWEKVDRLEKLREAMDFTKAAITKQEEYVQFLPSDKDKDWEGDFRLHWLRGRLAKECARLGRDSDQAKFAHRKFQNALDFLEKEARSTRGSIALNEQIIIWSRTKILQDLMELHEWQGKWGNVWGRMSETLKIAAIGGGYLPQLEKAENLLARWRKAEPHNVAGAYGELVLEIKDHLRAPTQRASLLLPFSRIAMSRYRIGGTGREERDTFLEEKLSTLTEWELLAERHQVPAGDEDRAMAAALKGQVLMEIASFATAYHQKERVSEALECFESAVLRGRDELSYYVYLTAARALDWRQRQKELSKKEDSKRKSQEQEQKSKEDRELAIRQRDAFYAFEQTAALLQNRESPDYYYESEQAEHISNYPEAALQTLLSVFSPHDPSDDNHFEFQELRESIRGWVNTLSDATPSKGEQDKTKELIEQLVSGGPS